MPIEKKYLGLIFYKWINPPLWLTSYYLFYFATPLGLNSNNHNNHRNRSWERAKSNTYSMVSIHIIDFWLAQITQVNRDFIKFLRSYISSFWISFYMSLQNLSDIVQYDFIFLSTRYIIQLMSNIRSGNSM